MDSEEWMMAEMRGSREGRQDLTRTARRGSNWQVDGLDLVMKSEITGGKGVQRWRMVDRVGEIQMRGRVRCWSLGAGGFY